MEYILSTLTFTGISLIGVLGVYLVTGLTGLFSFGQAAFLAIGAYVSAVLVKITRRISPVVLQAFRECLNTQIFGQF